MQRIEDRKSRIEDSATGVLRAPIFYPLFSILVLAAGCTYNHGGDDPPSMKQKQDQVVNDPINYKPDNENTQPYDITGGGFNNLDSKALKKDLDHVLDP